MSSTHLTKGSTKPALVEGKLRLYSMEYCPFAHRARLVLLAKGIPHDIVNINLINKPEWILDIHPEGKVPALVTDSKVVVESLDIADFLDKEYPDPPLYPAEPHAREQDKAVIKKIGALVSVFSKVVFGNEKRSAEECLKDFIPHLEELESEFEKRGTKFFGGHKPGMIDYMLWPWAERAGTVALTLGERLPLTPEQFPLLRAWRKEMRTQPAVDAIYHGPEKFHKVVLFKTAGAPPDYDSV